MPPAKEHAHCTTSMQEDGIRSPEGQHGGAVDPPQHRIQDNERDAVECALPQSSATARPCGRRVPSRLQPWECTACTFENAGGAFRCNMCDTVKPTAAVQQSGGKMSGAAPQQLREAVAGKLRRLRLPRGMGQWTDSTKKTSKTPEAARCKSAEVKAGRPPSNVSSSISALEAAQASELAVQRPVPTFPSLENATATGTAEASKDRQGEKSTAAGKQPPAVPSTHASSEAAGTTAAVHFARSKGAEEPRRQSKLLSRQQRAAAGDAAKAQRCKFDPPPDKRPLPATDGAVQSSSGKGKRPRSKSAQRPARAGPTEASTEGAKRFRSKSVQRQRVSGRADQQRQPAVAQHADLGRDAPGLARKPALGQWACPKRGWRFVSSGRV